MEGIKFPSGSYFRGIVQIQMHPCLSQNPGRSVGTCFRVRVSFRRVSASHAGFDRGRRQALGGSFVSAQVVRVPTHPDPPRRRESRVSKPRGVGSHAFDEDHGHMPFSWRKGDGRIVIARLLDRDGIVGDVGVGAGDRSRRGVWMRRGASRLHSGREFPRGGSGSHCDDWL